MTYIQDDKKKTTSIITTERSEKRTVNYYLLNLARELLNICLTRNTAHGNLFSGGLGPWGYLQMKMSENLSESSSHGEMYYLLSALDAARAALEYAEDNNDNKQHKQNNTSKRNIGSISLFTNEWIGAKCLLAAILYKIGKSGSQTKIDRTWFDGVDNGAISEAWEHAYQVIQHLETTLDKDDDNNCGHQHTMECNILYGGAGALQVVWFLRQELQAPNFGRQFVIKMARNILIQGYHCANNLKLKEIDHERRRRKVGSKPIKGTLLKWQWKGEINWGTIHGMVGILHTLLGMTSEEWIELEVMLPRAKDIVRHTIDNLEYDSTMLQDAISGKHRPNNQNLGWSEGLTGYCLLLLKAAEVFDDVRYVERVRHLGQNIIWPCRHQHIVQPKNGTNGIDTSAKSNKLSVGLTGGLSGNAYVFVALSRLDPSNATLWRLRAHEYTRLVVSNWEQTLLFHSQPITADNSETSKSVSVDSKHWRPYSLYTGLGGLVALLLDLEHQEKAHFPLYEAKERRVFHVQLEDDEKKYSHEHYSSYHHEEENIIIETEKQPILAEEFVQTIDDISSISSADSIESLHINSDPTEPIRHKQEPVTNPLERGEALGCDSQKPAEAIKRRNKHSTLSPQRKDSKEANYSRHCQLLHVQETKNSLTKQRSKKHRVEIVPRSSPNPSSPESHSQFSFAHHRSAACNYRLATQLLERCIENSAPEGTLLTGGVGACVYLRLQLCRSHQGHMQHSKNKAILKAALSAAQDAVACAEHRRGKFHVSLLAGEWVGAKSMLSAVHYKLCDVKEAYRHATEVVARLSSACESLRSTECSVLYGRAGALQVIYFLREQLMDSSIGSELAVQLSRSILIEGTNTAQNREKSGLLLMWKGRGGKFLGAAHGVVGILYSLLGLTEAEWSALEEDFPRAKEVIYHTINGLEGFFEGNSNRRASEDTAAKEIRIDWCEGATGYCLLLIRAYEVFNTGHYLQLAKHIAESVLWPRRTEAEKMGVGLFRGLSGIAYVFLTLSRADTADGERLRYYANTLTKSGLRNLVDLSKASMRPYSLMSGTGSLVTLLLDLESDSNIGFPGYIGTSTSKRMLQKIPYISNPNANQIAPKRKQAPKGIISSGAHESAREVQEIGMKQRPVRRSLDKEFSAASQSTNRIPSTPTMSKAPVQVRKTRNPSSSPQLVAPRRGAPLARRHAKLKIRRLANKLMAECLTNSTPSGNLATGGMGSCTYLRLHLSNSSYMQPAESSKVLKAALEAARQSVASAKNRVGKFQVSLLTGEYVGANCLLAAILFRLGEVDVARHLAFKVINKLDTECSQLPPSECEVMYGRAGALQAVLFLRQQLEDPRLGQEFFLQTSRSILLEGVEKGRKSNAPTLLMWEWKGKKYLGASHGVVGILQTLLGQTKEEWEILENDLPCARQVVRHAVEKLRTLCHPSGNLRTIFNGSESDDQMNWSHGAPGHCLLLIRAAEVFKDTRYLTLAKEIATSVIWERRNDRMDVGLAYGISGMGYVFLALARADSKQRSIWLSRAELFVIKAVSDREDLLSLSKRRYSLFEGQGGLVRFLLDMDSLVHSGFPLYDENQSNSQPVMEASPRNTPKAMASPSTMVTMDETFLSTSTIDDDG